MYIKKLKEHYKFIIFASIISIIIGLIITLNNNSSVSSESMKDLPIFLKILFNYTTFDMTKYSGRMMNFFSYYLIFILGYTMFISIDITNKQGKISIESISPVSTKKVINKKIMAVITTSGIMLIVPLLTIGLIVGIKEGEYIYLLYIFINSFLNIIFFATVGLIIGKLNINNTLNSIIIIIILIIIYGLLVMANLLLNDVFLFTPIYGAINPNLLDNNYNIWYPLCLLITSSVLYLTTIKK